jgi:hypothetical protein
VQLTILLPFLLLAFALIIPRPSYGHGPCKERSATDLSNKIIPEVIKHEAEAALSYFPTLADASIEFRFKKNIKSSMMQAQPRGFFKGKKGRHYIININERFFIDDESYAIKDVPSDVLIGWLVHELGHIMDYHERSSMGLVVFGFKYVTSGKYLRKAERAADTYAVDHGCGEYLVSCKEFILGHEELSEAYKAKIRRSYLCPDTIKSMLEEREIVELEFEDGTEAETF